MSNTHNYEQEVQDDEPAQLDRLFYALVKRKFSHAYVRLVVRIVNARQKDMHAQCDW